MSCTHTDACPLFPKLNASLRGWRDAYCDSDRGWRHCARYNRSLSGVSVPLTLLPNGKYAHALARPDVSAGRFDAVPAARPAADPDSPFEDGLPATAARREVDDDPFAGYGTDRGDAFGGTRRAAAERSRSAPAQRDLPRRDGGPRDLPRRDVPAPDPSRRAPADRDLPDLTTALPLVIPGSRRANGRPGDPPPTSAAGTLFGDRAVAVAPAAPADADAAPLGWWARLVAWLRSPV